MHLCLQCKGIKQDKLARLKKIKLNVKAIIIAPDADNQ